ncbi:hypothetical protein [Novosphingobium sp. 17-62-19]|uniref:hypothetical protein n=1 Tax=Novosphingobium sp. 17-62-19 TaxID=1970406 RepID=UPI0025E8EF21|nr:hypothetical protein [Novosphingobium sp. 17-62-19]
MKQHFTGQELLDSDNPRSFGLEMGVGKVLGRESPVELRLFADGIKQQVSV